MMFNSISMFPQLFFAIFVLFILAMIIARNTNKNTIINAGRSNNQNSTKYTQHTPLEINSNFSKFCVFCGRGNIDTAEFCSACGSEIPRTINQKNIK